MQNNHNTELLGQKFEKNVEKNQKVDLTGLMILNGSLESGRARYMFKPEEGI